MATKIVAGTMSKVWAKVQLPKGRYCRVWGKIHCRLNEDVVTGSSKGICRLLDCLVEKDRKGQSLKDERCPAYEEES